MYYSESNNTEEINEELSRAVEELERLALLRFKNGAPLSDEEIVEASRKVDELLIKNRKEQGLF